MPNKKNSPGQFFSQMIPFIGWLRPYTVKMLQGDALAGLTVAVILIPQAMAYAMLAGLPPVYGLYAAAVTPMIGGLWGSLRQLATGPIAITSLLVLTTLSDYEVPGSPEYIELAFLLSLIVGIIYLVIGLLRLGQVMSFISHSAVQGFTAAAALIIIASQLPHLLGIDVNGHEYIFLMLLEIGAGINGAHLLTSGIGILCFIFIYTVKKYRPTFPSSLTALAVTTGGVVFFRLEQAGVAVVGRNPGGLPGFHMPMMDFGVISALLGPAVVIALVSFAETYSIGKAISAECDKKLMWTRNFSGRGWPTWWAAFSSATRSAVRFPAPPSTLPPVQKPGSQALSPA